MHIVGIGASAGGLQAIRMLLSEIPKDVQAAFVVVQHLPSDEISEAVSLLQPYTALKVVALAEDIAPEQGRAYVMTGARNVLYEPNCLKLVDRANVDGGVNLPIDLFFHSLGNHLRQHAIGVVLSGSGFDGSIGIRTIKENGGMVFLQDPNTADFPGMIQAVQQHDLADEVLSPDQLGKALVEILDRRNTPTPLQLNEPRNLEAFHRILDHVSTYADIDFHAYRPPTLARRVEKRLLLHHQGDITSYLQHLLGSETETADLASDFLIGVTRFFRDLSVWQFFERDVVPRLYAEAEAHPVERPVRVWVTACATGEEAYTIALLLEEHRRLHSIERQFKLFATDVDQQALRTAEAGQYPVADLHAIPQALRERYFDTTDAFIQVKERLRSTVIFARHDCLKDPPFVKLDLITCRNFLIYLRLNTQRQLLNTFHFSLREEGWLLLGPSESIGNQRHIYREYHGSFRIFRRERVNPGMNNNSFYLPDLTAPKGERAFPELAAVPTTIAPSVESAYADALLQQCVAPTLFVNKDLDVLYLHGNLNQYFHLPRTGSQFNLHGMTTTERANDIQNTVWQVLRLEESILLPGLIPGPDNGKVHLRVSPIRVAGHTEPLALLGFIKAAPVAASRPDEPLPDDLTTYVQQLETNLVNARERTQRLVESVETTNLELQASNRELQMRNDELQTTNAELQSVNEELYTVNGELQVKNEALTLANNDINNLLTSSKVGTLFLDTNLRIRRFTPDIRELFDLLPSDVGRPIAAFDHHLPNFDLLDYCKQVYSTLEPFRREVRARTDDCFLLDILPYYTEGKVVKGLVLTLFDINSLVADRKESLRLAKNFEAIFHQSNYNILLIGEEGKILDANRELGKYGVEQLRREHLSSLLPDKLASDLDKAWQETSVGQIAIETLVELPDSNDVAQTFAIKVVPTLYEDDEDKDVPKAILIAENITGVYSTFLTKQDVLRAQKRQFQRHYGQVVLIDLDGIIQFINYVRYTPEVKPTDLEGLNVLTFAIDEDQERISQVFARVRQTGQPEDYRLTLKSRPDVEITATAAPVYSGDKVTHLALFHYDEWGVRED